RLCADDKDAALATGIAFPQTDLWAHLLSAVEEVSIDRLVRADGLPAGSKTLGNPFSMKLRKNTVSEVFVDTYGWASGFVETERLHTVASALLHRWQQDGTLVVTTNYVLSELVALLTSPIRLPRSHQIQIINALRAGRLRPDAEITAGNVTEGVS